jgi:predicted aspartyl protease
MRKAIGDNLNRWLAPIETAIEDVAKLRRVGLKELRATLLAAGCPAEDRWRIYAVRAEPGELNLFRRELVSLLEEDKASDPFWYWLGQPHTVPVAEQERKQVVLQWEKWLTRVEKIVVLFEDTLADEPEDMLEMLDAWRQTPVRGATRSAVWDLEKEKFVVLPMGVISWEMRRNHLIQLATKGELNWGSVLPTYLSRLSGADDYSSFRVLLEECNAMAEMVGCHFPVGKSKDSAKTQRRNPEAPGVTCYSCRKVGHFSKDCPAPQAAPVIASEKKSSVTTQEVKVCFNCQKPGHFAKDCKLPKASGSFTENGSPPGKPALAPKVQVESVGTTVTRSGREVKPPSRFGMLASASQIPRVRCSIDLVETEAAVDSGSDYTLISAEFAKTVGVALTSTDQGIAMVSGSVQMEHKARAVLSVHLGEQVISREVDMLVVDGLPVELLLGVDWISKHGLSLTGDDRGEVRVWTSEQCGVCETAVQTASKNCAMFAVSEEQLDYEDDELGLDDRVVAVSQWHADAINAEPLSVLDLEEIETGVDDPEIELDVPEAKLHPVIQMSGYPQSAQRQAKAEELLTKREEVGHIRPVKKKGF